LIAQTANQGTVSPTHFHVITSDDTVMNPERLQGYTNRLTHLYFNWPVKFEFYFLMMTDYTQHSYLGAIIDKYKTRLITIDPGTGMMEFCQLTNNYISKLDKHPNITGHKLIADTVYRHIKKSG